jgi:TRAP-type mannitol/chloroaromatic compound transport system substrate-binding protein
MQRRAFISALGLGAAGAALSACKEEQPAEAADCQAPAGAEISWKLVTSWPRNFPGLGMAPERFAREVNRLSKGRMQVRVYGAGELVPALQVFDAVSSGTAEMGHSGAYYWKGKAAESQFFTSVPYGLTAQEISSWIHHGDGMALWEEVYAPFGIKPLAGGNSGVQMAGWFKQEINSLADIKGLKMRIPGLGGEVFRRAGGVPVTIAGGELFTALQTGVIDATEWVGPYNDLAFGLYKAARHYYYPGWHEPGSLLEFQINRKAWDALDPDLQAIVEAAAMMAHQGMIDEYTARNQQALRELVDSHGVDFRPLPDDVLSSLRELSEEVVWEVASASDLGRKVFDSYDSFRKQVMAWHEVSEMAFLKARSGQPVNRVGC